IGGQAGDREGFTGDVGGERGLGESVVPGAGTAESQSAHGNADTVPDVGAGEGGGVTVGEESDGIAAYDSRERVAIRRDRGDGGLIVDLVVGCETGDGERHASDVSAKRGLGERVVSGAGAAQSQTAYGDADSVPDVRTGKCGGVAICDQGDGVAAYDSREGVAVRRDGGCCCLVVDLIVGGQARDGERFTGDVSRERGLGERVVSGAGAAQSQTAYGDADSVADVGAGEGGGVAVGEESDGVAAHDSREGVAVRCDGGCRRLVVNFVVGGYAGHRDLFASDVCGERGLGESVVPGAGTAESQSAHGN